MRRTACARDGSPRRRVTCTRDRLQRRKVRCKREAYVAGSRHEACQTLKSVRCTTEDLPMGQRRYPECVTREGKPRLRSLEDVVALPRRSPLAAELQRALAAASRLHGLRSDLSPVPVRATATITEAGAYRFRLRDPIDLRVSRIGGRSALGFLHELGHLLDHQIFYDRKTRSWASAVHPAFAPWRESAALLGKAHAAGRLLAATVLPVRPRNLGTLVRADGVAALGGPCSGAPPREAAGRRRRTHLVRGRSSSPSPSKSSSSSSGSA